MVMAESEETTTKRPPDGGATEPSQQAASRRLTVWCKSLVFGGDGYAVFDDADGRIVFRVDNYGVGGQGSDMALMDHAGRVLLTVGRRHRKMLSLMPETWEVYNGDVDDVKAIDGLAEQHPMMRATKDFGSSSCTISMPTVDKPNLYRLSWSRQEEWSRIYRCSSTGDKTLVAEVQRKFGGPEKATLLGKDVLSLVVQPGMDHAITMAMLMSPIHTDDATLPKSPCQQMLLHIKASRMIGRLSQEQKSILPTYCISCILWHSTECCIHPSKTAEI